VNAGLSCVFIDWNTLDSKSVIYSIETITLSSCLKHLGGLQSFCIYAKPLHLLGCETEVWATDIWGGILKFITPALYSTWKKERRWDIERGIWTSSLTYSPLVLENSPLRASLTHISCLALYSSVMQIWIVFFLFTVDWSCTLCCLLLFISLSYISLVLPHSCKTHVSISSKRRTSKSLSSSVFLSCQ